MKNTSIRLKILSGVVLINLIGAAIVVVYMHQSYSAGLDDEAQIVITHSIAAWDNMQDLSDAKVSADPAVLATSPDWLNRMKDQSGNDYFLLLEKEKVDPAAYAEAREASGQGNNWDEHDMYVTALSTSDELYTEADFNVPAGDVPETGKLIGIENGSCSKMCHDGMTVEGDYWTVAWSDDSNSRAHGVFPVSDDSGQVVGVVYSIENITRTADMAKDSMVRTVLVILATLLVATLVIGGMLDSLVFKRLAKMITSIEDISMRVAGGDFDAHYEASGSNDEIGKFEKFFSDFIGLVSMTMKSLMK